MPSALDWLLAAPTMGASVIGGAVRESDKERRLREMKEEADRTRPGDVSWQSLMDPQGNLKGQYQLGAPEELAGQLDERLSGINLNTQALEALRGRGLSQGPSSWANYMLQKQGIEEQKSLDDANATSAAGAQTAWQQLAMRGGASGGERERIALASGRSLAEDRQKALREGSISRMGILGQDESTKLDILKSLPGMETQALQPALEKARMFSQAKGSDIANKMSQQQFNLSNLIAERDKQKQFEQEQWKQKMAGWGAEQTARATEESGRK